MDIDQSSMSLTCDDCPKPKKSKTSEELAMTSQWDFLPDLVLTQIFEMLNKKDRENASTVCKHWRENYFHPRLWSTIKFSIQTNKLEKARFLIGTFGLTVTYAKVAINSLSSECVDEFINLLRQLSTNNNLKSLIFEPSHCRLELPAGQDGTRSDDLTEIIKLLKMCLPKLSKFSIGCIEDLSLCLETILENLNPSLVTDLGLASVKDDPERYILNRFDPAPFRRLTKLEVLSIDYDHVNDEFLDVLESATELKRFIIHFHGVRSDHPGTSDGAWVRFKEKHPKSDLCFTVIHAFRNIENLHRDILRRSMPLSHLKVFFCELVNLHVIENLSHYAKTLRSIVWVDSLTNAPSSWALVKPFYDESPDPFVLTAWLCKNLEEIVLFGYKYWEENLIAIGRLRGEKLKRLDIAETDIVKRPGQDLASALLDIPNSIDKPWKPLKRSELHPVICNPIDGDSDEYILPLVLADFH